MDWFDQHLYEAILAVSVQTVRNLTISLEIFYEHSNHQGKPS